MNDIASSTPGRGEMDSTTIDMIKHDNGLSQLASEIDVKDVGIGDVSSATVQRCDACGSLSRLAGGAAAPWLGLGFAYQHFPLLALPLDVTMRIFDFVCRRQPWDPQSVVHSRSQVLASTSETRLDVSLTSNRNDFPYYVHNNDVLNCCLVSKAWLKITRPYLYLCVHITSWRALELFLRTLYDDDKDRRLRSLVRAFNWLPLPHNKPEETAAIERLRHFTPLNQVTGLCPTLKHINFTPEAHVLEDSWSSWHAALERARAEGRLNIESIGCPADCPDDLIRVIFVLGANLKELTIIGDLSSWSSLTIDKFLDVLRLNSIDASERSGHFTSGLRKLRFVQPTSWDPHSGIQSSISWDLLKRVPTACSSLEDIRIDGDSFVSVGTNGETFDLDHFISELNPTTMRHLSIGPYHILGDKATNTFDRVPEHFHALQTICGPMKCFSLEVFARLAKCRHLTSLTVWTDRYDERYGDHFPVPISLETYPAIRALTHVAQEMLEKGLPLNANATDSNKVYDTFDIVDRMFRIARRQAELKFGAGDAF